MSTTAADLPPKAAEFARILQEHMPELERQYGVASLALFGSYVRGEEREDSDLDVLVDLKPTNGPARVHRFGRLPLAACWQARGSDHDAERIGAKERTTPLSGGRTAVNRPVIEFLRDIIDWMENA